MPSLPVHRWSVVAAFLSGLSGQPSAQAELVRVADELARLQAQYGFELKGEQYLEEASGRGEGDDLFARLRLLLERFDYIIVQTPDGGVERVIIIGRTSPAPERPMVAVVPPPTASATPTAELIELPTIRTGSQHSVEVTLEGVGGRQVQRLMLVDTGASAVVLPSSMIGALGLAAPDLGERQVHTANGTATARVGQLPMLWLGDTPVGPVEVAFLPDDKLNAAGLLGMNVLGRWQMTIDDGANRLTLTRR